VIYRAAILGAAGASFSPLDVSGLQLWLDASDETTITESSGSVSQWDDKSGNGNHVTQGTAASQPSTGVNTKNGRNVLTFAGNEFFTRAHIGLPQPFTIFAMARRTSSNVAQHTTFYAGSSDTSGGDVQYRADDGTGAVTGYAGSSIVRDGASQADGTWIQAAVVFNGASSKVYYDSTPTTGNPGSDGLDNNSIAIGRRLRNTGAQDLIGDIAELLVYDGALSNDDVLAIRNYFSVKWDVALP